MEPITEFVYIVNGMTAIVVKIAGKGDMAKIRYDANKIHKENVKRIEMNAELELKNKKLSASRKLAVNKELNDLTGKRSPKSYDIFYLAGKLDY